MAAWKFHENIKNSRLNSVLRRHFRSPPTTSLIFDVVIPSKHFQQFFFVFANVRVVCGLLKVSIIIIVIVNTLSYIFCSLPSEAARASSASWIHLIKDYCELLFERFLPDVSKSLLERQTVVSFKFLSRSDRLLFLIWRSERSEGRNWINNWMNTQWGSLAYRLLSHAIQGLLACYRLDFAFRQRVSRENVIDEPFSRATHERDGEEQDVMHKETLCRWNTINCLREIKRH